MEAAPEGLIEVKTAPSERRGHGDAINWANVIPWLRDHPWREYQTPPVPSNAVARWRARYPEVRFRAQRRRWVDLPESDGKSKRSQLQCDLYVTWTGGEHGDETGDES